MKKKLAQEKEHERRNALELKQHAEVTDELKKQARESEMRKMELEKRLGKEVRVLRQENAELKNQLLMSAAVRKELQEARKEVQEARKRKEMAEKEVRMLKAQFEQIKFKGRVSDIEHKMKKNEKKPERTPSPLPEPLKEKSPPI